MSNTELVYYNTDQVAEILNVPKSTLQYWRTEGLGPKFSRIGRHIRYTPQNIQAWIEANQRERS